MAQQPHKQEEKERPEKKEQKIELTAFAFGSLEYETAYVFLLAQDYVKAIPHLELAADKGYPPACVWLHAIYEYSRKDVSKNPQKASHWLEKIVQALGWYETHTIQGNWQAAFCLVYIYNVGISVKKDSEKALQWCEAALKQQPMDIFLLTECGHTLDSLSRYQEALTSYEAALAIDPKYTVALASRANTLYSLQRYAEALASYKAALAIDPKYTVALAGRGNTLYSLQRYAEALASYKSALAIDPKYTVALAGRGNTLYSLQRYAEALASYGAALAIDPKYTVALYNRGLSLYSLERYAEALASFEAALAIDPKYTVALAGRGDALRSLNRPAEALASFEAALAIDPKDIVTLTSLGHAFRSLSRPAEALASYEAALVIDAKYTVALAGRGAALRFLNRPAEALASYKAALAIDPKHTAALTGRGNTLYFLKNYAEALASYEAALVIDPKYTAALVGRGAALRSLNRLAEALASYEMALVIDPKYTVALAGRGNTLHSLERYAEALASYEAALAIDPKSTTALNGRQWCLKQLGNEAVVHKIKQLSDAKDSKASVRGLATVANFKDYPLSTAHASTLAELLMTHPTLTALHVDRSQLSDAGLVALTEALSQNVRLTTLTLTDNPKLSPASAPFQTQVQAYLYRNRLLTAHQITPAELHDLDMSVVSGEDLHRLLTRHATLDAWDFSHKQLDAKATVLQPAYLPHYPTLRTLDLRGNHLGDAGAQQIGLVLTAAHSPLSNLLVLKLGNNGIRSPGFRYLAEAMASCENLEVLDLCQNDIQVSCDTLRELAEKFAQNPKLQRVVLSGNQLLTPADKVLKTKKSPSDKKEDKPEKKEEKLLAPAATGSFFYSEPLIGMMSVIDPAKPINRKKWVVALGCQKGHQHAILYLEGMRWSGQRFLERYHIVASDVVFSGKAKLVSGTLELEHLAANRDKHDFSSYSIKRTAGEELQSHIRQHAEAPISFSKFHSSSDNNVNCTGWCIAQLRHIGIEAPNTFIPSKAAGGGCSIM